MGKENPKYSFDKSTAVAYKVRLEEESGWGIATIREWPKGGSLDIQSDFGNYSFTWTSIGPGTLREFLCGLSIDYAMNKLSGYDLYELDFDETIKGMKEEVLKLRRKRDIDGKPAREAWDDIIENVRHGDEDENGVYASLYVQNSYLEVVCCEDPLNVEFVNRIKPQIQMFWDKIWCCFVEVWKQEIKEEKATPKEEEGKDGTK